MNKPATTISIVFLSAVAIAHTTRFLAQWAVNIDGMSVPLWLSGVAAPVLVLLAVATFREKHRA